MPNSQEAVHVMYDSAMSSDEEEMEHLEMEDDLLEDQEENMSTFRRDLENIANLQAELLTMSHDDDGPDAGCTEFLSPKHDIHNEDIVMDENVTEVEIETERPSSSPDEIIPDVKEHVKIISSVPSTLKAIAPKPQLSTARSVPKANIITAAGQQIVLIQSPGGTANAVSLSTGQPIKLVSQTGQPVTLPQFQSSRQQIVKTVDGNIILRTIPKTINSPGNVLKTSANVKRVIPATSASKKVIMTTTQAPNPNQITKTETGPQVMKIITNQTGASTISSPSKTITLAQAQEIGLITQSQVQQWLPQAAAGKQFIINKSHPKTQLIKLTSNQLTKSPTKILPAPKFVQKQSGHKVIIKQGGSSQHPKAGQQIIRIPAGQLNSSTAGQIHQINVPGQGIQYVRLSNASLPAAVSTASGAAGTNTLVRTTTTGGAQAQTKLQTIVPVALLNRPANTTAHQSVVKVVPIATNQTTTSLTRPVVPKTSTTVTNSQRILAPTAGAALIPTSPGNSIVMLPTQFVQMQQEMSRVCAAKVIPKVETPTKITIDSSPESIQQQQRNCLSAVTAVAAAATLEPNGLRPRKPCNCTKSQCLKLYCDCFANGEFCYMCNCVNCFNNLDNEEERQKAIRSCLERNPSAFRPKIGKGRDTGEHAVRKHTKGCNCKRSGCLKNYCECYEAKIACSSNCKCMGCRNIEDSLEKKSLRPIAPLITLGGDANTNISHLGTKVSTPNHKMSVTALIQSKSRCLGSSPQSDVINFRPMLGTSTRKAFSFMTNEVIEATVQCLLASAEQAEKSDIESAEKKVIEEFGRCLVEIIETAQI